MYSQFYDFGHLVTEQFLCFLECSSVSLFVFQASNYQVFLSVIKKKFTGILCVLVFICSFCLFNPDELLNFIN